MMDSPQKRWLVATLLLAGALLFGGAVSGGVTECAEPLEEPTIPTATPTPGPPLPTSTPSDTPGPTATPSITPEPTNTATVTNTFTPSLTPTITKTPTVTSTPTMTHTPGPNPTWPWPDPSVYIVQSASQVMPGEEIWIEVWGCQVGSAWDVVYGIEWDPYVVELVGDLENGSCLPEPEDECCGIYYSRSWGSASLYYECFAIGGGCLDCAPLLRARFRGLRDGTTTVRAHCAVIYPIQKPEANDVGSIVVGSGVVLHTPTPTPTATATRTSTPTETPLPTLPPPPSATPESRTVHGTVLDPAGVPVAKAQLTLYRNTGEAWTQQAVGPSGADGVFRMWMNPIPGDYRLMAHPPAGYSAVSAALPEGMDGQVVSADTLEFTLGGASGQVGPFAFVVELGPTSSPLPTLPPVVVQGFVWLDMNGDGQRQPREGLAGVEVTLSPGGLSSIETTTTDAEGHYSFVRAPGDYTLAIHDPMGRVSDQSRAIDTEAWEPGPIDWGNWSSWLPLISQTK